jgi:non-ribosomal peptide synthetase component F
MKMTSTVVNPIVAALTDPAASSMSVMDVAGGLPVGADELLSRCLAAARRLRPVREAGVLAAVAPDKPFDAVGSVIAALLAQVPFLPLDPRAPRAAVDGLVARTGAVRLSGLPGSGPPSVPDGHRSAGPLPADVAYATATSGTTGTPRVALIGTDALAGYLPAIGDAFDLGPRDVVLQGAPFGFDVWLEEVLPTLVRGGRVVLTQDGWRMSYQALAACVEQHEVTVLNLPSGYWNGWVEHLGRIRAPLPPSLRLVVVGSERVPAESARRWLDLTGDRPRLIAGYGLVEATITSLVYDVTARGLPDGELDVPLGTPIARTAVGLTDEGELLLSGPSVFAGYLGEPETTADRLRRADDGTIWLHTGDYADLDADGVARYRGRRDDQTKVNGHRVNLSAVRAIIEDLDAVDRAVVVLPAGGGQLAAAVASQTASAPDLIGRLRELMPSYQVPAQVRIVLRLPVLPNGKVDLRTVRSWFDRPAGEAPVHHAAATDVLGLVVQCAERLLKRRVGPGDNFFALGGNSLIAIQLISELALVGLAADLRDIFGTPTLAALADALRATPAPAAVPRRPVGTRSGPLSLHQQGVWVHARLFPASRAYNAQSRLDIDGPVDPRRLREALAELTRRHEVLRTSFHEHEDGTPYQLVHDHIEARWTWLDCRADRLGHVGHVGRLGPAEAEAVERQVLRRKFDLEQAPLAHWTLVSHDDLHHTLYLVEHHLVHDGVSFAILMQELRDLLDANGGTSAGQAEPGVGYLDYALWQQQKLLRGEYEQSAARWADALAEVPDLAVLVERADRAGTDYRAGTVIRWLDAETARSVRAAARAARTTLFVFLLSVYSRVLSRRMGQLRFAVGVGVANRQRPELARTVGMLVNTMAIPVDWSDDDPVAVRERLHAVAGQAFADQSLPFPVLVRRLNRPRRPASTPVYQVTFSFDDAPLPPMRLGEATAEVIELQSGYAKVDLSLVAVPQREQRLLQGEGGGRDDIRLIFQFRRGVLDDREARAIADDFVGDVRAAIAAGEPAGDYAEESTW